MDSFPVNEHIECETHNGWLTVWFNQPERRNPLTDAVIENLSLVCDRLESDSEIRGVTFRGRGGFFCAGGDLKSFSRMAEAEREQTIAMSSTIGVLLARINRLPQVSIALIEGAAMAGGLGLACSCDVAIATDDALFGFSETKLGITPAQIAPYVLHKCGAATGRRLLLTAARFKGQQARDFGLLDDTARDAEALDAVEQQVRTDVLACAPGAVAACKALILAMPDVHETERVRFAAENFTDCLQGDEGREGVASFLEKRKPYWQVEA